MEQLRLSRIQNSRETLITVGERKPVLDTLSGVHKVEAFMEKHGRVRHLSFVSKKPRFVYKFDDIPQADIAKSNIAVWQRLKKAEVPTISGMWWVSEKELFATDMTATGAALYGRYELRQLRDGSYERRLNDGKFLAIPFLNIERRAHEVADIASTGRILLPTDDPMSVIVKNDGTFETVVHDFDFIRLNHTDTGSNHALVGLFLQRVRELRKELQFLTDMNQQSSLKSS